MSSSDTSASVRLTGRVKWFNNKTGFGFITIVGGDDQFKDASEIFAHHSAINVSQEQYRYLVEGEYVEFSVSNTASGDHKFQAADIRGVKGGKLFCETRHEQRSASAPSHGSGDRSGDRSARDGERPVRGRQSGRGGSRGGRGEWMLVRKDSSEYRSGGGNGGGGGGGNGGGNGGGRGGRGGRVYSARPSGDSYMSESYIEHSPSKTAPQTTPAPTPASASQSSDVTATPRAASARKPRQSNPSS